MLVSWLSASNGLHLSIYPPHSTAFTDTLANDVLAFNLNATIAILQNLSATFASIGTSQGDILAMNTNNIISQLEDIRDGQLPNIEDSVDLLEDQVDELSGHIDNVVVSVRL